MPDFRIVPSIPNSETNPLLSGTTLGFYIVDDSNEISPQVINNEYKAHYIFGDPNAETIMQGPRTGQSSNTSEGLTKQPHCYTVPDGSGIVQRTLIANVAMRDSNVTYLTPPLAIWVEAHDSRFSAADTVYVSTSLAGESAFVAQGAQSGAVYQSNIPSISELADKRWLFYGSDFTDANRIANDTLSSENQFAFNLSQSNFIIDSFGSSPAVFERIKMGVRNAGGSQDVLDSDAANGFPENILIGQIRCPNITMPSVFRNIALYKPDMNYSAILYQDGGSINLKATYNEISLLSPSIARTSQRLGMNLNGSVLRGYSDVLPGATGVLNPQPRPAYCLQGSDSDIYDLAIFGGTLQDSDSHNARMMGGVRHAVSDLHALGGHTRRSGTEESPAATGGSARITVRAHGGLPTIGGVDYTQSINVVTGVDDGFQPVKTENVNGAVRYSYPATQQICYQHCEVYRNVYNTGGDIQVIAQTNTGGEAATADVNGIYGVAFYKTKHVSEDVDSSALEVYAHAVTSGTQFQKIENLYFYEHSTDRSNANAPYVAGATNENITNLDQTFLADSSTTFVVLPSSAAIENSLQFDGAGTVDIPLWTATGEFSIALPDFEHAGGGTTGIYGNSGSSDYLRQDNDGLTYRLLVGGTSLTILTSFAAGDIVSGMTIIRDANDLITFTIDGYTSVSMTRNSTITIEDIGSYAGGFGVYDGKMSGLMVMNNAGVSNRTYNFSQTAGSTALLDSVSSQHGTLVAFTTGGFVSPAAINATPILTRVGDRSYTVGDAVDFTLAAIDVDGAIVSFAASELPAGLILNTSTGRVTGTTTAEQTITSILTATDDDGGTDTESVTFTVAAIIPDTDAPVIVVAGYIDGDVLSSITVGDTFTAPTATATDNVDGSVIVTNNTIDTSTAGNKTLTYTAQDAAGNVATFTLIVPVSTPQTGTVDLQPVLDAIAALQVNVTALQSVVSTNLNAPVADVLAQATLTLKSSQVNITNGNMDTNLKQVNDINVTGSGTQLNPWVPE